MIFWITQIDLEFLRWTLEICREKLKKNLQSTSKISVLQKRNPIFSEKWYNITNTKKISKKNFGLIFLGKFSVIFREKLSTYL